MLLQCANIFLYEGKSGLWEDEINEGVFRVGDLGRNHEVNGDGICSMSLMTSITWRRERSWRLRRKQIVGSVAAIRRKGLRGDLDLAGGLRSN
jgi:hypothetical protein